MSRGERLFGPKRNTRRNKRERRRERNEARNMRKAQLVDFVAKRRKQKKEQGREGSNFEESGGRGI